MNMFHRSLIFTVILGLTFAFSGSFTRAQEVNQNTDRAQLEERLRLLQEQIVKLRTQINDRETTTRQNAAGEARKATEERQERTDRCELFSSSDSARNYNWEIGDESAEIRQFQEYLARSHDVYPEGLTTGYYGPLTARAVSRLQVRLGLEGTGEMNPSTFCRLRQSVSSNNAASAHTAVSNLANIASFHRWLIAASSTEASTTDELGDNADIDDYIDELPINSFLKSQLRSLLDSASGE